MAEKKTAKAEALETLQEIEAALARNPLKVGVLTALTRVAVEQVTAIQELQWKRRAKKEGF
jgi:hypothetical protein